MSEKCERLVQELDKGRDISPFLAGMTPNKRRQLKNTPLANPLAKKKIKIMRSNAAMATLQSNHSQMNLTMKSYQENPM